MEKQPYDDVDKVEGADDVTDNSAYDSFDYSVERRMPVQPLRATRYDFVARVDSPNSIGKNKSVDHIKPPI